jgi:hypothetical protein
MERDELEKFFKKHGIDEDKEMDEDYDGNWENHPIPEGKRLVFRTY